MILALDFETYCETPIKHGVHRYAEGVEIIISAWAIDDQPVQVAEGYAPQLTALIDIADDILIHNSGFDRTVLRHAQGVDIPVDKIRDTMVQAQSHGLPGGLDKLCDIFGVSIDKAKDKQGKALIQLFCRPWENRKVRRATSATHPIEWGRFLDYAKLDVEAMRDLYRKMPRVNYPSQPEHALWCLDQRMNDRGFLVDTELAEAAIATVAKAKKIMDARTQEMTDDELRSTTQRDQTLKFVLAEYGVDLPDLQRSTLERRLGDPDLPDGARELLAMRLQTSTTSNAKYNTLLKAVSADGRLRGTMQFSGAARTKRWAGRGWQVQNLPRPDMSEQDIEDGIELMKVGACHLICDNPIKVASNAIRGSIIAARGHKLVVSDLKQIEARVLPWLAGEAWKLEAFRQFDAGTGPDLYRVAAGRILGKKPEDVTKDERQARGKVPELSMGYGGSVGAFKVKAIEYGAELLPDGQLEGLSDDEIKADIVGPWRQAHPAICDWDTGLWKLLDQAARMATLNPGKTYTAGRYIRFERFRNWLRMELPSGGFLNYADPKIIPYEKFGGDTLSFMGVHFYTKKWTRLTTYGGKLAADATQGTAREILAANLPLIEEAGYLPIALIHDETVTETPDSIKYSVGILSEMLSRQPRWAEGLPLAADGFSAYRYRKDS